MTRISPGKPLFRRASFLLSAFLFSSCFPSTGNGGSNEQVELTFTHLEDSSTIQPEASSFSSAPASIDTALFKKRIQELANGDTTGLWPAKNQPIPLPGAILPAHRIIAYYGNLYSKRMGALGEYAPEEMWERLNQEVSRWNQADSTIKAIPALHYIAVVASDQPGSTGKYRNRMPFSQIDSVLSIAKTHDALVFLDIQVGQGTLEEEIPALEPYLKLPHVHLGIDPEFSMKGPFIPGKKIGTFTADDVNFAINYLDQLVKENNLPPKILIVHRFTKGMVQETQKIKPTPAVQFVLHMDGWGSPELKKGTYRNYIHPEPVDYTGFKIFYKNDIKKPPHRLITIEELLALKPKPIYIQYQ